MQNKKRTLIRLQAGVLENNLPSSKKRKKAMAMFWLRGFSDDKEKSKVALKCSQLFFDYIDA